jgi:5-formyltetrahydrofolate cyclo-ligase
MSDESKHEVRKAILAKRRSLSVEQRQQAAEALVNHIAQLPQIGGAVCAYVPVGGEPGSPAMLDVLADRGARVLLPVTTPEAPLSWGEYRAGHLVPAAFGLQEPAGRRLPPETIAEADLVLIPALAVDQTGVRLGRGAGFYDRSLPLATPDAMLVAVVYDDELLPQLPAEPHDVPMTHALAPGSGLVRLAARRE